MGKILEEKSQDNYNNTKTMVWNFLYNMRFTVPTPSIANSTVATNSGSSSMPDAYLLELMDEMPSKV